MYIGAIIRQRRKELNLSQADLSHGICVSSHLSKIENGEYQPTNEIKQLLLKKLDIEDQFSKTFIDEYKHLIDAFHHNIFNFQITQALEIGDKILKEKKMLMYSPLHLDFFIVLYAYHVVQRKSLKKSSDALVYLNANSMYLDDSQKFLKDYYKASVSHIPDNYEKLLHLDKTGYIHFRYGMSLEGQSTFYKAVEAYSIALNKFVRTGSLKGLLFSMLFKGSALFNMKAYDEAIEIYDALVQLSNTAQSADPVIQSFVFYGLNNKAESYLKQAEYEAAIQYANEALEFNQLDDGVYGIFPYLILAECFKIQGKIDEGLNQLKIAEKELDLSKSADKVYELFYIKKLKYQLKHENYLEEKDYLNLLLDGKKKLLSKKRSHLIHQVNEDLKAYYCANRYYKKALDLMGE